MDDVAAGARRKSKRRSGPRQAWHPSWPPFKGLLTFANFDTTQHMNNAVCARIRLKPDSLARVREWAREINSRRPEALATLAAEGVAIESVFLDSGAEGDFLVYYLRARSIEQAAAVAANSSASIDAFHQEFKREVWTESVRGNRLNSRKTLSALGPCFQWGVRGLVLRAAAPKDAGRRCAACPYLDMGYATRLALRLRVPRREPNQSPLTL